MSTHAITLSRHILEEELRHPEMAGELSRLLMQVGYAAKILAREIGRAALVGQLGLVGDKNASGDAQKKLDVYSNDVVVDAFAETGLVAGLVSEELDEVKTLACASAKASYVLCIDPLDGSSNTDINGAVGTIFGIYRRQSGGCADISQEMLRKGAEQVAAGYVMYGTSTLLVYTCGHGVHGFTLDRELGEFLLSHENIRCPARGKYYSANLGRFYDWPKPIQDYIAYLTARDPASKRPYSLRYVGALVADVHRGLLEGGIYFYPPDADHPNGKLRLLYECAPLAFVVEQAGGRASTGRERILDIQASSIHQRVPLVIGSQEDVALYEKYLMG
ncbi:MAG: class 1 fructose-bisphosphatase [Gammaproteobacteria bacterium]